MREVPAGLEIHRVREVVDLEGQRTVSEDRIVLDTLSPATLAGELLASGLELLPPRAVPATSEYVGSAVVMACG